MIFIIRIEVWETRDLIKRDALVAESRKIYWWIDSKCKGLSGSGLLCPLLDFFNNSTVVMVLPCSESLRPSFPRAIKLISYMISSNETSSGSLSILGIPNNSQLGLPLLKERRNSFSKGGSVFQQIIRIISGHFGRVLFFQ